jgi:outer membrane protein
MQRSALLVVRVGVALLLVAAVGQAAEPAAATDTASHRVALVDIGYIFKNYQKFSTLTASLGELIEESDTQARAQLEQMRALQERLNNTSLASDSPEQKQLAAQLVALQNALQASRQVNQRDLVRKEAEIYKTAYLEVQDSVKKYAKHYGYTLVLQFTRPDLSSAGSARDILDQLNNPVIYYSAQDDISDPILQFLNETWTQRQGTTSPAAGVQP